jgi:putative transposase
MPYLYRKLTLKERKEILNERRKRGYPLHAPPHLFRGSGYYLITAANYEHAPIISSFQRSKDFELSLLEVFRVIQAEIFGWVILPNHYHILIRVESLNQVSIMLQKLHGKTSREWNLEDGKTGKRQVWYKFSDQFIRDDVHFYRVLNYIHFNPIKHGYVEDPYDWPWTSIHQYFENQGKEWLREKWISYPPGNFGKGWDEK